MVRDRGDLAESATPSIFKQFTLRNLWGTTRTSLGNRRRLTRAGRRDQLLQLLRILNQSLTVIANKTISQLGRQTKLRSDRLNQKVTLNSLALLTLLLNLRTQGLKFMLALFLFGALRILKLFDTCRRLFKTLLSFISAFTFRV